MLSYCGEVICGGSGKSTSLEKLHHIILFPLFVWWEDWTLHLYHRQKPVLCLVSSVVKPGTIVSVLTIVLSRGIYVIVEKKAEFISILYVKASCTSSLLQCWEGISLSYHRVFLIGSDFISVIKGSGFFKFVESL